MASQLPSWKSQLMQKPDRLAWVKSVLGGIPLHRLLVLTLPKKTLKLMEKIERGFIWKEESQSMVFVGQMPSTALAYRTWSALD
jgi:hypothetical protein